MSRLLTYVGILVLGATFAAKAETAHEPIDALYAQLQATTNTVLDIASRLKDKKDDEIHYEDKPLFGSFVRDTMFLVMEVNSFMDDLGVDEHSSQAAGFELHIAAINRRINDLDVLINSSSLLKASFHGDAVETHKAADNNKSLRDQMTPLLKKMMGASQQITENYNTKFSGTMAPFDGWRFGADDYGAIHIPPGAGRVHCVGFPYCPKNRSFCPGRS